VELQEIQRALDLYIRPSTYPVAIKLVSSMDELPERARRPKRDWRMLMPVCQGVALARRYGWLIGLGAEDMLCPLGGLTLGFLPARTKSLNGRFNIPFWVKDREIGAKILQDMPRLQYKKHTHIVLAPLHRAEFEPQVILVYGNPAQVARLIQAVVYSTGEPIASASIGGIACAGEITKPLLTDQFQFIVVGAGDRAFAQTQDHEVSFAIPISKAEMLVEGLEATHKAGLRYPTPSFLKFQVEVPQSFSELLDSLRQSD